MPDARVAHRHIPATGPMDPPATPLWPRILAIIAALLLAAGAIIALVHPTMLVSPIDPINGAVRIYAGYLASRNIVLAAALLALLWIRAPRALSNTLAMVAFIQFADAILDGIEGRWTVAPGVVLLGILFLIAAARLGASPWWKRQFWQ
jgi:hypothetical protein